MTTSDNNKEYSRTSDNKFTKRQGSFMVFFTFDARKPEFMGRYVLVVVCEGDNLLPGLILTKNFMQHTYSELDFTATFLKLRLYAEKYNAALRETNPKRYRKDCIKSTHVETAKEILRFYGAYLINNKKKKLDPNRPFVISQARVGKYKLAHQVTIYRHVRILQEKGIITNADLKGCMYGIHVCLNVEILAKKEIKGSKTLTTATFRPEESGLPNVKITGSYVDKDLKSQKRRIQCRKQGSREPLTEKQEESIQDVKGLETPETQETGMGRAENPEQMWINAYTTGAWDFAKGILYSDKQFTENQEQQTKTYISEYFIGIPQNEFYAQNIHIRFQDFGQRVLLAKAYLDKSPERYVPLPWVWFDKNFENGFKGTYTWMKQVRERRKKNKDYYSNLALLCKEYHSYCEKPSLQAYKKAEEVLKLKQDGKLWQLFNQCVLTKSALSTEQIHSHLTPLTSHVA